MARRRMLQTFEAAKEVGNYADTPVMPADVDPQITISRNWVRQPFYLAFEEDTVIALMSGSANVRLRDTNVHYWPVIPGDHIYVPAGTPHRLEPHEESVLIRFIGNDPAYRAAVFACEQCSAELDRLEWKQDLEVDAVAIYAEVVRRFNDDLAKRTCPTCGTVADEISLDQLGGFPSPLTPDPHTRPTVGDDACRAFREKEKVMTLFVSVHQAPALDPAEVAAYVPDIKLNTYAEFQQVWINLEKGLIVTLYQGDDEAAVRKEFDRIGWPVDSVNEVHFSLDAVGLAAIPA